MSPHTQNCDYSRYFRQQQKVFLINMSEERNTGLYESLSGVVIFSNADSLALMITTCCGIGMSGDDAGKTTYKLTSEALGSGIQVMADLIEVTPGNILQFRMHGQLELFQRRIMPRIELSARILHLTGNASLASFKKQWERITENLHARIAMPEIVLQETTINLGAGGVGLLIGAAKRPSSLSLFVIELPEAAPVCAVAESIWEQRVDEGLRCGFRFIHILKEDQERINSCVRSAVRSSGGAYVDYKRNWVLLDRMLADMNSPE